MSALRNAPRSRQLAKLVVDIAVGEVEDRPPTPRRPAVVYLRGVERQ